MSAFNNTVTRNGTQITVPYSSYIKPTDDINVEIIVNEGYRNSYSNMETTVNFEDHPATTDPGKVSTPAEYKNTYSFHVYGLNDIQAVQTENIVNVTVSGLTHD